MSSNLTSAYERRNKVAAELTALRESWTAVKKNLDTITELVSLAGVDAARVFFVLGVQDNNLNDPTTALVNWTHFRLTQVEALEALSEEHKIALNINEKTATDMGAK